MTNRKYKSDGHAVEIDFSRVKVGTVIRSIAPDGGISPFSDAVVIGITVRPTNQTTRTAPNVQAAIDTIEEAEGMNMTHRVEIVMARPYIYADSIGIVFNHLMGVEKYSCSPENLKHFYRMVENSTGELAVMNKGHE